MAERATEACEDTTTIGEILDDFNLAKKDSIKKKIVSTINLRKKAKKSCSVDNVIKAMEELDLTSYDIEELLQELLREEILTNCIHKGKTILKVNASKNAESSTVQDISKVSPDEEFEDDFIDFKKFVTNSLTKLSEKIESLSCNSSTQVKKFNCKLCDG